MSRALHRRGHVQMVLNQKVNFRFLFPARVPAGRRRFPAPADYPQRDFPPACLCLRHAAAGKESRGRGGPPCATSCVKCAPPRIRRLRQLLQVLDRAQRMFVHRVAVIKVAHHQRIDGAEFRQHFKSAFPAGAWPQRHPAGIRAQESRFSTGQAIREYRCGNSGCVMM